MPQLACERFRPKPGYMLDRVDNELLIYHPAESLVIYCNTHAALVWQLLDGERTRREIAELLAEAFAASPARVEQDVSEILADLHARGAIETAHAPQAAPGLAPPAP